MEGEIHRGASLFMVFSLVSWGGKGNHWSHWPGQAAAATALPAVPGSLGRCLVEAVPRGWKGGRSWSPTSAHPNCFLTPLSPSPQES